MLRSDGTAGGNNNGGQNKPFSPQTSEGLRDEDVDDEGDGWKHGVAEGKRETRSLDDGGGDETAVVCKDPTSSRDPVSQDVQPQLNSNDAKGPGRLHGCA